MSRERTSGKGEPSSRRRKTQEESRMMIIISLLPKKTQSVGGYDFD